MNKLAVFDLDGTLTTQNSLFYAVRRAQGTLFFDSLPVKLLDRLLPVRAALYQAAFDRHYAVAAPPLPELRRSAVSLLRHRLDAGWRAVILSSAPEKLLAEASLRLGVPHIRCRAGLKHKALPQLAPYSRLLVCTDNKNDAALLQLADERVVFAASRDVAYFKSKLEYAVYLRR